MTIGLVLLATFLMWTMWICAYLHQMYPLARATVPTPPYKVRCVKQSICQGIKSKASCEKLWGWEYNDVTGCQCITNTANPEYDPECFK